MARARKVIHWDGRNDRDALDALHALPPGEYMLVPVNDTGAWDLSDEDEADLERALDEAAAQEGLPADQVLAELRAKHGL